MTTNFLDLRPDHATIAMFNGDRLLDAYQIKGDGTDVSSDMAALFRSEFAGASDITIKVRAGAKYLLRRDIPIDLEGMRNCHLDFRGATWINDTRTRLESMFNMVGCRDTHIWSPRARGFNPTPYSGGRLETVPGVPGSVVFRETTLTGTHTRTQTTFMVANNANFPTSGSFTIRSINSSDLDCNLNDGYEEITYTGKTGTTQFDNCVRGAGGTIADEYRGTGNVVYGQADLLVANDEVTALPASAPGARRLYLTPLMTGQHSGITADHQMLMGFYLSSASGTPSVKITVYDQLGSKIVTSRSDSAGDAVAFNVSTTPTEYVVTIADGAVDPGHYVYPRVLKVASDGITVRYHTYRPYSSPKYKDGNHPDTYYDNGGFIGLVGSTRADRNQRIYIHDMDLQGFAGDAFDGGGEDEDIFMLGGVSRCNARQGITFNLGGRYRLQGVTIREPGRSGIDIEPSAREVNGTDITDCTFMNIYGFAGVTSAVGTSRDLRIQNSKMYNNESTAGMVSYTGRGGYVKDCYYGPYPKLPQVGEDPLVFDIQAHDFDIIDNFINGGISHTGSGYVDGNTQRVYESSRHFRVGERVTVGKNTTRIFARTSLNATATAPTTTLTVKSSWMFPNSGNVSIVLEPDTANEETVRVLTVDSDTQFTLAAATAITHASGSVVHFDGSVFDTGRLYAGSGIQIDHDVAPPMHGLQSQAGIWGDGTWKGGGKAYHKLWHPGGDVKLDVPVLELRGVSGGTTRPNNLRGVVTPANAATSVAVTFPVRTFYNPSFDSATAVSGGSLTSGTQYGYVVAGHNLYGGPRVGTAERTVTPSGTDLSVQLRMSSLFQSASREMILGVSVFRRATAAGATFTRRWDWLPTKQPYEIGVNLADYRLDLTDDGTDLLWTADSGDTYGYDETFTGGYTSRTGDPNSGAWTPGTTDETGYERGGITYHAIVTYSTFNMGTQPWITARTLAGFTINWTTAAPTGAETVGWSLLW